ncbi:GYF domain-containing protein [uncultured Rubinisphaera sp.]|uniref:DUF4339 domain-containing protein n=1 Tax=uncultured Rubinisphaera sp. TaxID=1678686 RepID=UPI0030DD9C8D
MSKNWYRLLDGKPDGPYTAGELQQFAAGGQITPTTKIWKDGTADWVNAEQVKGFQFANPGTPPGVAPIIPAVPVVDAASLPQHQKRSSNTTIIAIIASCIGMLCIGGIAFLALQGKTANTERGFTSSNNPEADTKADKIFDELQGDRDALRDEIKKLKEDRDSLKKERSELQDDNNALERKQIDLQKNIDNLVSRLEAIKSWQDTEFVLFNPGQTTVGMKVEPDCFRVVKIAEGSQAEDVIGACRNWHIPRVSDDPSFVRDVSKRVSPGDALPVELEKKITSEYWKRNNFVPFAPEISERELELVTYRDLESYDMRFGVFLDADPKGLTYFSNGKDPQTISWSDVQAGSARRGPVDDVMRNLTSVDFLEYCLLRVAQKLGTPTNHSTQAEIRPRVLVRVEIDVPDDHLRHYEKIDQQLEQQGQPLSSFQAEGLPAILLMGFMEANRASIPGRRLQLRQQMLETDPHKKVRHLSRYVEDEVLARLSSLNLLAITQQDQNLLASMASLEQTLEMASVNDATHLLRVIVKNSRATGDYHLSVRLYREDGGEVWVDEGDRVITSEGIASQYHVSSGNMGLIYLNEESYETFQGTETPKLVEELKNRSSQEKYSHLVYVESRPDAETVEHRTLFSNAVHSTAAEDVKSIKLIESLNDVPTEDLLRFIACRVAENALPSAGRVIEANEKAAIVGLGKQQRVAAGDRLRVMRMQSGPRSLGEINPVADRTAGLLTSGEYLLPTELVVTQVASRQATVSISPTGLDDVWPGNLALRVNDLVIMKNQQNPVVAIEQLSIAPLDPRLRALLGRNARTLQRFEQYTQETGTELTERIQSAVEVLNIPVIATGLPRSRTSVTSEQASHKVYGSITLSKNMNTKSVNPIPIYRVELKISPANSTQILEQFDFEINDIVRPSR